MHSAELSRIPGAADARVKPEHDAERAIPTHTKTYLDAYADKACPCEGGGLAMTHMQWRQARERQYLVVT
jgi:hypothetical protein